MKRADFIMGILTTGLTLWLVYLVDISSVPGNSGNKYLPDEGQILRVDQ